MKWDTEYYGMIIYAEDHEEAVFLKAWAEKLFERLPRNSMRKGSYDGDDQYGIWWDGDDTDYGPGAVYIAR